ncbi:MAG: hypothetical protein HKN24_02290 [Acidimicrobiales bacterium]|nr:hypothetical protein [Acidimicrobiales bacterium]
MAHLDLSEAVREQRHVDMVVWTLSTDALGKRAQAGPTVEQRRAVLEEIARDYPWLEVQVTDAQLISDIAIGFDVVVMGADKWDQINDPIWYPSATARDEAIAALPEVAVAPRPPHPLPSEHAVRFENNELVSSTAARAGAHHLMLPQALASGLWT